MQKLLEIAARHRLYLGLLFVKSDNIKLGNVYNSICARRTNPLHRTESPSNSSACAASASKGRINTSETSGAGRLLDCCLGCCSQMSTLDVSFEIDWEMGPIAVQGNMIYHSIISNIYTKSLPSVMDCEIVFLISLDKP